MPLLIADGWGSETWKPSSKKMRELYWSFLLISMNFSFFLGEAVTRHSRASVFPTSAEHETWSKKGQQHLRWTPGEQLKCKRTPRPVLSASAFSKSSNVLSFPLLLKRPPCLLKMNVLSSSAGMWSQAKISKNLILIPCWEGFIHWVCLPQDTLLP